MKKIGHILERIKESDNFFAMVLSFTVIVMAILRLILLIYLYNDGIGVNFEYLLFIIYYLTLYVIVRYTIAYLIIYQFEKRNKFFRSKYFASLIFILNIAIDIVLFMFLNITF